MEAVGAAEANVTLHCDTEVFVLLMYKRFDLFGRGLAKRSHCSNGGNILCEDVYLKHVSCRLRKSKLWNLFPT